MFVNKFPYQKLSRTNINGKRHYSCPDGSKLPSVTSILDQTKPEKDKQSLNSWKNRVGHTNAATITAAASARGTKIHSYLEKYILTEDLGVPGTNPFAKESHKMANHIVTNGLVNVSEFYGSEVSLFYKNGYAGSTDCVGLYKGELAILDFKQTNKPKLESWVESYRLQLCGYIWSHNQMFGTDIRNGFIMMCDPKLTYQQFEINKDNFNYYSDLWWQRVYQYYSKLNQLE